MSWGSSTTLISSPATATNAERLGPRANSPAIRLLKCLVVSSGMAAGVTP